MTTTPIIGVPKSQVSVPAGLQRVGSLSVWIPPSGPGANGWWYSSLGIEWNRQ
jgi:hypothetical protein